MGDPNVVPELELVVPVGPSAAPVQPSATQAPAPAAQTEALLALAQAPAAQAPTPEVHAQALATEAQALSAQARAFAARVRDIAAEAPLAGRSQALPEAPADKASRDQAQAFARPAQAFARQAQALADQAQALVDPNNGRDAEEKTVFAYKEIANLHDINENYPIHKLALEEWQRREKYLSNSESRREGRSAEVINQIYNIVGWFSVFQGLVLTSVSQLTQTANTELGAVPLCGKIWFPIVLTGFATVVTIVGILRKFTSLQALEYTIHSDRQARVEVAKRTLRLRNEGPLNFKFHKHTDNFSQATKVKLLWKNSLLVIVLLVIWTAILVLSYFAILCDTWVVHQWDKGIRK